MTLIGGKKIVILFCTLEQLPLFYELIEVRN